MQSIDQLQQNIRQTDRVVDHFATVESRVTVRALLYIAQAVLEVARAIRELRSQPAVAVHYQLAGNLDSLPGETKDPR